MNTFSTFIATFIAAGASSAKCEFGLPLPNFRAATVEPHRRALTRVRSVILVGIVHRVIHRVAKPYLVWEFTAPQRRGFTVHLMKNVNLPTLMAGEIVVHASTATVGRVVKTLYPLNHKMADIEQELLLLMAQNGR